MPWVITVAIDPDKNISPAVGTATAVFTDTDATVFTFSQRATLTAANATAFRTAAVAARNAWQSLKAAETTAESSLVTNFTGAGETATAGTVPG